MVFHLAETNSVVPSRRERDKWIASHGAKTSPNAISQCGIVQGAANVGVTAPRKDRNNRTVCAGNLETPSPGPMKVYGSDDFSDPPGSRKASGRQPFVNVERSPRP